MQRLSDVCVGRITEITAELKAELRIEVKTFIRGRLGMSCAHVRMPSNAVGTHGWIFGELAAGSALCEHPVFLGQSAAVHAQS